jgi:hypothetical protein
MSVEKNAPESRSAFIRQSETRKTRLHHDGGGLYLQVTTGKDGGTNKSWLFRFMLKESKPRWMGLGSSGQHEIHRHFRFHVGA